MKLIVFISFFSCVLLAKTNGRSIEFSNEGFRRMNKAIVVSEDQEIIEVIDLNQPVRKVVVYKSDVAFYYSTNSERSKEPVSVSNIDDIDKTSFNASRRTMFTVHGWHDTYDSDSNSLVREGAFDSGEEWNVFAVDWDDIAQENYLACVGSLEGVGAIIARFILDLSEKTKLDFKDVQLVGHSLGAHICGYAGAKLSGRIGVIVGLDPAGPLFDNDNTDDRLDPTDAQYVETTHTSSQFLGMSRRTGHSDYYPNGGYKQPGCTDFFGNCAHIRAYIYYAESLTHDKFSARACKDEKDWKKDNCKDNEQVNMGGNQINTNARGTYFLDTNEETLFAKG